MYSINPRGKDENNNSCPIVEKAFNYETASRN
jgi:hypothetical protein